MSTIEAILTRAMSDHEFADLLFTDAEKALTEYNLPVAEIAKFKGITRADFEALTSHAPEERKSLAKGFDSQGRLLIGTEGGLW